MSNILVVGWQKCLRRNGDKKKLQKVEWQQIVYGWGLGGKNVPYGVSNKLRVDKKKFGVRVVKIF